MELMEIKDNKGHWHYVNPSHISAICEVDGQCKINLMGHDYMVTQDSMEEVKYHLTSFTH